MVDIANKQTNKEVNNKNNGYSKQTNKDTNNKTKYG